MKIIPLEKFDGGDLSDMNGLERDRIHVPARHARLEVVCMRVAVICNNHFSKSGGSANNRIIGSVAFVNQARAAFIVTPDEKDKTRRLLIPSKTNIGPEQYGLAYRIEGCLIHFAEKEIAKRRARRAIELLEKAQKQNTKVSKRASRLDNSTKK
jgi:hypothetical protein